jgi:ATP-dependent DNA helicase RecG
MDLNIPIAELPHIGPSYEKKLNKLGIITIKDLLNYVPSRYLDFTKTTKLSGAQIGDTITVKGTLTFIKNQYTKSGKKIQLGEVKDSTGSLKVVWFYQPFLTRVIFPGDEISFSGTVDWFGREKALISPDYEKGGSGLHTGRLVPIYPETAGLSSKWLRTRIFEAFTKCEKDIVEFLPDTILSKNRIVNLHDAISKIHFPSSLNDALIGRKRLAFEELLKLHLRSIIRKINWRKNNAVTKLLINDSVLDDFIKSLPFDLTAAQINSIAEIRQDLSGDIPMNRLLEGDVGSGKTVVATVGILTSFLNGHQSVVMAPTQILAKQHYETLKKIFNKYKINISLHTSGETKKSKKKSDLIIGTHSLLHNKTLFDNVAFVVIDEQHKFGVNQRNVLIKHSKKGSLAPHILTMTATPIPRTIALTFYGDMDLSVLNEMPKGRIKPTTWLIPPEKREAGYEWIDKKINEENTQLFVICPLIDDSDSDLLANIKAVKSEYLKLKAIFNKRKLGLLHGKLKNDEKDKVIRRFRSQKIDILVSTPVIEVGIDIPNANIMIIEGAERFGLAQLHQLRGRIGRGSTKSYCLLYTENSSEKATNRLEALRSADTGFELSELDLKLRGPGEIFGTRQHGFPELKIASWQDFDLIKLSKEAAEDIYNNKTLYNSIIKPAIFSKPDEAQ